MPSTLRRLLAAASLVCIALLTPAAPGHAEQQPPAAPTYKVFATREGLVGQRTANGHIIQPRDRFVALPFRGALARNGGQEFQVRVTYRDRSVVLPVWDIGPWNISDDYWSPSRRYSDLPVGKPMAQAAHQDGYNGGRDDSGRRVGAPNGIDIADGAFWDDLGMHDSDWVQVSFLWLGADAGARADEADRAQTVEPDALVVDNNGDDRFWTSAGAWSDAPCGTNDYSAWARGTSDAAQAQRAGWKVQVPAPGNYAAFAYIPPCGEQATSAARYRVTVGDTSREISVSQRDQGGRWVALGTYRVEREAAIELSTLTKDRDRAVRLDAVRWVPRP